MQQELNGMFHWVCRFSSNGLELIVYIHNFGCNIRTVAVNSAFVFCGHLTTFVFVSHWTKWKKEKKLSL